jgi:hypothetical protein
MGSPSTSKKPKQVNEPQDREGYAKLFAEVAENGQPVIVLYKNRLPVIILRKQDDQVESERQAPEQQRKQQQEAFQARKTILETNRTTSERRFLGVLGFGIALLIISGIYLTIVLFLNHTLDTPASWPAAFLSSTGVLFLCFCPLLGSRLASVKEQIQSIEFEHDLLMFASPARENRAEKLLRIQEFQIRRY